MLSLLTVLAGSVASGIGRRFEGGLLSQLLKKDIGDLPPSILWAVILLLFSYILSHNIILSLIIGLGIFVGSRFGYYNSMKVGTELGGKSKFLGYNSKQFIHDFCFLSLKGLAQVLIPICVLFYYGVSLWYLPLLSVLLFAPLYRFAYIWCWNITFLGCLNNEKDFDPPPTAELTTGFLNGLTILLPLAL